METSRKSTPTVDETHLKLIMGLKLKQLRSERGMSLTALANATDISVSYLNEIEKGKKFPKPDKIALLANTLDVSYDWLVSVKTSKKLAPVTEILQSKIMKEVLLDVFGIDKNQMMELLSRVPVKLNAFLNTIIEISRNYGMRVENFYHSALRSYQEMHENYFEEIERSVDQCLSENNIDQSRPVEWETLANILMEKYSFRIEEDGLSNQPELRDLRSVFIPGRKPVLLLNKDLDRVQKTFILARELGFRYMGITERPQTTPWTDYESFEQVLNNFKGSYFACAFLLSRDAVVDKLKMMLAKNTFNPSEWLEMIESFNVSPEIFAHRLTNLLPKYFGIQELFFLRFTNTNGTDVFELTKEMHLAGLHNPHANMLEEHYCRRWISINILKNLSFNLKKGISEKPLCMAQRSRYFGNEKEYLILSFAKPAMHGTPVHHSISIGLLLTSSLKKKVQFWNDVSIPIRMVGETCQRCPATDCAERMAEPQVLIQSQKIAVMKTALEALSGR